MPGDDGAGKTCRTAVRRTLELKNNRRTTEEQPDSNNRIREQIAAGRSRVGTSSGLAVSLRVCGLPAPGTDVMHICGSREQGCQVLQVDRIKAGDRARSTGSTPPRDAAETRVVRPMCFTEEESPRSSRLREQRQT
jgi:hypothetical protein